DLEKRFEAIQERVTESTPSPPAPLPKGEGRNTPVRVIVLRVKRVRNPDAVCVQIFERFIAAMKERGIEVLLCGVRKDFATVLVSSGAADKIGNKNIFHEQAQVGSATLDAVRYAYELIKGDYCSTCPRRGEAEAPMLYYMI